MATDNRNQKVPKEVREKVAKNLKAIYLDKKQQLGLTQESIGKRMDLTQGTVGQY